MRQSLLNIQKNTLFLKTSESKNIKKNGVHRKTATKCGRSSAPRFKYFTCLLDRGHIRNISLSHRCVNFSPAACNASYICFYSSGLSSTNSGNCWYPSFRSNFTQHSVCLEWVILISKRRKSPLVCLL